MYSRITGYYRPVQNWNEGKAQEFKERKLYVIGTSGLLHRGVAGGSAPRRTLAPAGGRRAPVYHETCPQLSAGEALSGWRRHLVPVC